MDLKNGPSFGAQKQPARVALHLRGRKMVPTSGPKNEPYFGAAYFWFRGWFWAALVRSGRARRRWRGRVRGVWREGVGRPGGEVGWSLELRVWCVWVAVVGRRRWLQGRSGSGLTG